MLRLYAQGCTTRHMTANKYADLAAGKKTHRAQFRFSADVAAILNEVSVATRFNKTEILEALVRNYGPPFAKANAAKRARGAR